ncbi:MAG TPA: hypothetical protein VF509_09990 [Sphingobium sp.]
MATMKFSKKVSYLAIAGAAVVPTQAWAQVLTNPIPVLPSDYLSERVSVSERYRPEFQASGIPLGSLTVLPQLGVGGNYTSNVFGTAKLAQVRSSVRYFANRHFEINAEAAYTKRTPNGAAFGSEYNRFEFGVNLVGRL